MISHITAPDGGATVTLVTIAEDRQALRPDEPQKFNTFLDGKLLVKRHHVPMYQSCRALMAMGITGRVMFADHETGTERMSMDIVQAAGLTIIETDGGPRVRKYTPFPSGSVTSGRNDGEGADTARELEGSAA